MNTDVNEVVKAALNVKRVKLWLPPYCDDGGKPNEEELQNLARELPLGNLDQDEINSALCFWQTRALDKKFKSSSVNSLELKFMGLRETLDPAPFQMGLPQSWAQSMEVAPKSIKLKMICNELSVSDIISKLLTLLGASSLSLMHKGKTMENTDARLKDILKSKIAVVLCLVSYDEEKLKTEASLTETTLSHEESLIASIRSAAARLGGSQASTFEITDQRGNIVAMKTTERLAFLTALGLHRLGRKQMEESQNSPSSALLFLLQADEEWKSNISADWRLRVDNYGLLQLDICWVYLKLESLENLEDVVKRLDIAESVLRKQVHTNFVTLAVAQAEMGNAENVPPLSAIFCRLFLLQGIAYRYLHSDKQKSRERLDWSWSLCQSLRSFSTDNVVNSLVEAVGVSKFDAIAVLRRCHGNPNAAATLLEQDREDATQQRKKRKQQRELGLCENGMDPVNLDLLQQLQDMLGFSSAAGDNSGPNSEIAGGLLRLTNNDLRAALDLYQDMNGSIETLDQRVGELDRRQGVKKSARKRPRDERTVDEMALGTLVSMGVKESLAKDALQESNNNVEMSLLWLTTRGQDNADRADGESESAGSLPKTERTDVGFGEQSNNENHIPNKDQLDRASGDHKNDQSVEIDEELEEAETLLQKDLGEALHERDLEKEYLGCSLDEEWNFLEKYRTEI